MIYTQMTILAAKIAENAHRDQYDKGGMPYIWHPLYLAEQMDDEITTTIALLHDVVEDTEITFAALEELFPKRVIAALRLLTHNPADDYFTYIAKIKGNPDAVKVKRTDLLHNMDRYRLASSGVSPQRQKQMQEKYEKAYKMLSE